ncbi:MAG: hypothetical protein GX039_08405 [Clostridia bacterium]|nr:hypothetical protein [Clostridia bacterium]
MYTFAILATGLLAALLALACNHILLRLWQRETVSLLLGPVIEETSKTGLALLAGVSLAGVHSVFGFAEGIWELVNRPGNIKPALAAWGVHSLLGFLVQITYIYSDQAILAWITGCLLHAGWNGLIFTLHH